MSISHKNMPKNYGTLELNFFLHFYIISTIIIIVNRNPFMILFAPLCIIYLYSPQKSHQLPPDGSFIIVIYQFSQSRNSFTKNSTTRIGINTGARKDSTENTALITNTTTRIPRIIQTQTGNFANTSAILLR